MAQDPLSEALRSVFGPIVKQSAKWPPILAYGLPAMVAVLLIIALGLVVPLRLVWLLAIVVLAPLAGYIVVDWNTRHRSIVESPQRGTDATITFPKSDREVDRTMDCTGFASGIRPDMHIWLAVEAMGFIWPKEREVYVGPDNRWIHTIFEDGAATTFSVVLLIADVNGHNTIRDWLEAGKAKGEYAEIRGIPGTDRLARVDDLQLRKIS